MPRSLANGDYRLLMAIESSSRPNSWYRVLIDPRNNALSCDCPAWTFGQRGAPARECKHTDLALLLLQTQAPAPATNAPNAAANVRANSRTRPPAEHPLITATKQQWAGLNGTWTIEERDQRFGSANYHFVLLRLVTGNGITASGVVAFASAFHPTTQSMVAGVAGWAGYAIAAEVARRAGYALVGQPPQHFKTERRAARAGAAEDLSLTGILRVGDQVNLGDGLSPKQRAENTLRLFLGDLYPQLERQGFLDVPSACFTIEQRVYRLRRDPHKQRERRVRCFERGRYERDYCIKRAQDVPEADHWLTVFLGLISDEREVLSVVHQYNIFPPNSDGNEPEPIPAVWMARAS
jgi:hypothetical protein